MSRVTNRAGSGGKTRMKKIAADRNAKKRAKKQSKAAMRQGAMGA
jgi:hypothetical protein